MAYIDNILQPHVATTSEYMIPDWLNSEQSTGVSRMTRFFLGYNDIAKSKSDMSKMK